MQETPVGHRDIPRNLLHPALIRARRDARDVNASRVEVHEEEDVVRHDAERRHDFSGEEVGSDWMVEVESFSVRAACWLPIISITLQAEDKIVSVTSKSTSIRDIALSP